MTDWKPIGDNPPRDGRPVLLYARLKSAPAEKDIPSYLEHVPPKLNRMGFGWDSRGVLDRRSDWH